MLPKHLMWTIWMLDFDAMTGMTHLDEIYFKLIIYLVFGHIFFITILVKFDIYQNYALWKILKLIVYYIEDVWQNEHIIWVSIEKGRKWIRVASRYGSPSEKVRALKRAAIINYYNNISVCACIICIICSRENIFSCLCLVLCWRHIVWSDYISVITLHIC